MAKKWPFYEEFVFWVPFPSMTYLLCWALRVLGTGSYSYSCLLVNTMLLWNIDCFTHDFQNQEWPNVDSANRLDSYCIKRMSTKPGFLSTVHACVGYVAETGPPLQKKRYHYVQLLFDLLVFPICTNYEVAYMGMV